jgi:hypothetical protein
MKGEKGRGEERRKVGRLFIDSKVYKLTGYSINNNVLL